MVVGSLGVGCLAAWSLAAWLLASWLLGCWLDLALLLNEPNALADIGNVVNVLLLDAQVLSGSVPI